MRESRDFTFDDLPPDITRTISPAPAADSRDNAGAPAARGPARTDDFTFDDLPTGLLRVTETADTPDGPSGASSRRESEARFALWRAAQAARGVQGVPFAWNGESVDLLNVNYADLPPELRGELNGLLARDPQAAPEVVIRALAQALAGPSAPRPAVANGPANSPANGPAQQPRGRSRGPQAQGGGGALDRLLGGIGDGLAALGNASREMTAVGVAGWRERRADALLRSAEEKADGLAGFIKSPLEDSRILRSAITDTGLAMLKALRAAHSTGLPTDGLADSYDSLLRRMTNRIPAIQDAGSPREALRRVRQMIKGLAEQLSQGHGEANTAGAAPA